MKELWQPQSTAVAPHEFLAALWRLVPTFRGHQQQVRRLRATHAHTRKSEAAYHCVERAVGARFGRTLQDAQELLRYALEAIHADVVPSVPSNVGKTKAEERTSIVTDVFGGSLWNEVPSAIR